MVSRANFGIRFDWIVALVSRAVVQLFLIGLLRWYLAQILEFSLIGLLR